MKRKQVEIDDMKNPTECMGSRLDQREDGVSKIDHKVDVVDNDLNNTLKMTRDHANWIQQLLDDSKEINLRIIRIKKKLEDDSKGIH